MVSIENISKLLRYHILISTTEAGSGHVTSSLSSVELMASLFFKYFKFDLEDPKYINNDRLIFSKGHASPLFYALFAGCGKISEEELMHLRKFDSVLEGHPTKRFKYTEVPTGSLGQGLSAGVGMALSAKLDKLSYHTYVLLGDGEMAEGQIWEALEIASHYKLNNLIGIVDVNRLGQTGETLLGHNLVALENRIKSFGWRTYIVNNGHDPDEIDRAYRFILSELPKAGSPYMLIAKTIKGKGVSFLEDKDGWHGKALSGEECKEALLELGGVDISIRGEVKKPESANQKLKSQNSKIQFKTQNSIQNSNPKYKLGDLVATREAYGQALVELGKLHDIVVMDGDLSNSTFAELFKKEIPERYFEMYIAEQNMVGVGLGLSERGKIPYLSTYGSFFTRTFDQIRMANLGGNNIILCGSHAGVLTGQDGPSQMGLEDMSFLRSLPDTTVLYPSDAVSTYKLTILSYFLEGIIYIKTMRSKTPVIYKNDEEFKVGGSKILRESEDDFVTVISSGDTLHESIKAHDEFSKEGINIRVIDAYCIKPIDKKAIIKAAKETKAVISVEDHYITGGLGDAVLEALAEIKDVPVYKMGVTKIPKSGKPDELLEYEGINAECIVRKIREVLELQ